MTYSTSPNCKQSISVEELLAKTIPSANGCLEWQMTRISSGYGQIWLRGKMVLVHREIATLVYGLPSPKQMALHSCDNPPCINPAHLSWGSHSQNMKQMYARGRAPVKKPRPDRRLTYEIAEIIRDKYATGKFTYKGLGSQYGISDKSIEYLIKRKTYKK
jgi:hypothetical protein